MEMAKAAVFLTTGYEETEALATADILRRAGIETVLVSLAGEKTVSGGHKIAVLADAFFNVTDLPRFDLLVLPGGQVVEGYKAHAGLKKAVEAHVKAGKLVGAICAAPTYLAWLGLLKEKTAVCYPAMAEKLAEAGAVWGGGNVAADGTLVTSQGPATTPFFALELAARLVGKETAEKTGKAFLIDII